MSTKKWKLEHKEQMLAYGRKWYATHKEEAKARCAARRKELRAWLSEYKATLACSICSENHPACIVFHHRNPSEKETDVALACNRGWSKTRILAEIAKCDVLCANCHRKLHWKERRTNQ